MMDFIIVGLGLASIFYWIVIILGHDNKTRKYDFVWWIKIAVPQGIIIALATQVLGIW